MKIRNLFAISLAALAMGACSNDDLTGPDGPGNGNGDGAITGEPTWAVFNVKLGNGAGGRSATSDGGDTGREGGLLSESKIDNAAIFVFAQTANPKKATSEIMMDFSSVTNGLIPAEPVMMAAGAKHIITVANVRPTVLAQLKAAFGAKDNAEGYEKFNAVVNKLGTGSTYHPDSLIINTTSLFMTGESDPILKAGVTATEAATPGTSNYVQIYLNRSAARIDVKLAGGASTLPVKSKDLQGVEKEVGDVDGFKYQARNLKTSQYVMQQSSVGDFIPTFVPTEFVPATGWPTDPNADIYKNNYFPYLAAGTLGTYDKDLVVGATTDPALGNITYMPENTNDVAVVGNSTFIALSAKYAPKADHFVKGIATGLTGGRITLEPATTDYTAGQSAYFNFEYDLAFEAGMDVKNVVLTLARYHASLIEPSLKDIAASSVVLLKKDAADVTGDELLSGLDPADGVTTINWVANGSLENATNMILMSQKAAADGAPRLFVLVNATKNSANEIERLTITAKYYWSPEANGKYINNDGVDFGSLTMSSYKTVADGLQCYYRANIFDSTYGVTNKMYYSVLRNQAYHTTINKITKIGYSTDFDLVVKPEEPLNNNTFVQVHVVVNKWVTKNMGTDLGQ